MKIAPVFFETPALCVSNVKFLDNEVTAGLIFDNNLLKKVCLYTAYSNDKKD